MEDDDNKPIWWSELQELWLDAGQPSTRNVAAISGVSHTTVHSILTGERVPTYKTLAKVFFALGGDPAKFREVMTARRPPKQLRAQIARPDWASEQTELLRQILAVLERIESKL